MANIINNNFKIIKFKINKDEYWDLVLNNDMSQFKTHLSNALYDDNLIAYFDINEKECLNGKNVQCLNKYIWENAFSTNHLLENIGYTGFDNGLLYLERDKIDNRYFFNIYQNSTLQINDSDLSLKLHFITGSTLQYQYEYSILDDCIQLNGGFLQGFFKTECDKYHILPNKLENEDVWTISVFLQKSEFEKPRGLRLNDKYPSNKGIFFYIGTRAENKWIYYYEKDDVKDNFAYDDYIDDAEIDLSTYKLTAFTDMSFCNIKMPCDELEEQKKLNVISNIEQEMQDYFIFDENNCKETYISDAPILENIVLDKKNVKQEQQNVLSTKPNECLCKKFDYIEDDLDISNFEYKTKDGSFSLKNYESYMDYNNPFLLFNRTSDGYTINDIEKDSMIRYIGIRNKFNGNLFLLMNRTETGYTVSSIDNLKEEYDEKYDYLADLYENALAFRITDDGSIGYRYLVKDCLATEKYKIIEGYSKKNLIAQDKWYQITIKIICIKDQMYFKFFVNENLVFISQFLPKLNLRELNDVYSKQETVPFNISIGGGTQGLAETILPNYMINPYRVYPLEKHFAGSFIGYLKSFKFYNKNVEYNDIVNNFKFELNKIKK